MRKLEYFLWFSRAGINQLAPYLLVSYFTYTDDLTSVAELAAVFAAVGLANLTRSGAILSTVTDLNFRAPLWIEIGYSLIFTLPLILLLPQHQSNNLMLLMGILLASGISGVFAARIDHVQGLSRLAILDISCAIVTITVSLALLGVATKSIEVAFFLREITYCIAAGVANLGNITQQDVAQVQKTMRNYVRTRLGGTLFWISGPWKDFFVTNVGLAFYNKDVYGAYYSTQLYWSLPVLVLGLLLRPAYKDMQAGRLSIQVIKFKILSFVLVSAVVLTAIDFFFQVIPTTSVLIQIAVLIPLFMASSVTAATLTAVSSDDKIGIVVQNVLWGSTGCLSLYTLKDLGLTGIAYSLIIMNLSSAFILLRKPKKK